MSGTRKNVSLRGVHLWEVENVGFICGWNQKECLLNRGVHSWEGENVGFICGWGLNKYPLKRGVHS